MVSRVILLLLCASAMNLASSREIIKHPSPGDPDGRNQYQVDLLDAVMNATVDTHGDYELRSIPSMPQAREMAYLKQDRFFDVVWTVTNADRESDLMPVRFPILRGMLGHRVCMIRTADPLAQNGAIASRNQLLMGSETSWPDTQILLHNGLRTELGSDYQSLLKMLTAGRINCFPRGINEIEIELAAYGTNELGVDSNLSFLYFSPMYFFVAPGNKDLADRIHAGLIRLHETGEFEALFQQYHDTEMLMQQMGLGQRTSHCLENPNIPTELIKTMQSMLITGPGTYSDRCVSRD